MGRSLYNEKTHEWAATAAKLIVVGNSAEVVRDLFTMTKKQALLHLACLLGYHTTYIDNHGDGGGFNKFEHALKDKKA